MARIIHFSGDTELTSIFSLPNAEFLARFPKVAGRRIDSFSRMVGSVAGSREALPITRSIEYKSNPSKHVCDARCVGATGKIMRCECSCGGKNHGLGA